MKRYLFAKAYKLEIPISATLELLDMCNLRCEHCYLPEHTNQGLSTQQVKDVLDDMRRAGVLNEMWVHSPPLGAQANFNRIEKHDTM